MSMPPSTWRAWWASTRWARATYSSTTRRASTTWSSTRRASAWWSSTGSSTWHVITDRLTLQRGQVVCQVIRKGVRAAKGWRWCSNRAWWNRAVSAGGGKRMYWSPCFTPAGDKRHVVVILGRTCRRGELTGRPSREFKSAGRRCVVMAIGWARGAPVISLGSWTIEDFLLGIKAGRVCIQSRDNGV